MPVSDRYKQVISEWIKSESRKVGGYRALALKMSFNPGGDSITDQTLRNWRDGKELENGLNDRSIRILAAYQGMEPHEITAWLNGVNEPKKFESSIDLLKVHQKRAAYIDAVPGLIIKLLSTNYQNSMCIPLLSLLIRSEFSKQGLDWRNNAHVEIFKSAGAGLWEKERELALLDALLKCEDSSLPLTPPDVAAIAATLYEFSGKDDRYTYESVYAELKNAPRVDQERCRLPK